MYFISKTFFAFLKQKFLRIIELQTVFTND